jgi:transcriptional regulator with XRE-family HTH domain
MSIALRIKQKRQQLGLSQAELARVVGITQGSIAQIELGVRSPSLDILPNLARSLKVSTDFLLMGGDAETADLGQLNAADRLLVRRFCEFLGWLERKNAGD